MIWHGGCIAYVKAAAAACLVVIPAQDSAIAGHYEVKMVSLLREMFVYMGVRKKWWLSPIILMLLLIGGLIVLAKGSAVAPFIYTIF